MPEKLGAVELEVRQAAMRYEGVPVYNHFRGTACGGMTHDVCMERGLGPDEFVCLGLVVRALSVVMGRRAADWPRGLRHVVQTQEALEDQGVLYGVERLSPQFEPGDLLFFHFSREPDKDGPYNHIAIATEEYSEGKHYGMVIDAATAGLSTGGVTNRRMTWHDYNALRALAPAQALMDLVREESG